MEGLKSIIGAIERHHVTVGNQPMGAQRYRGTQRNDEGSTDTAIIALPSR